MKKPKRFFWREDVSPNGKNSLVQVFTQNGDGSFNFIGEIMSSRGSYRGGLAIANQIIHDNYGYSWSEPKGRTHYMLKRKDIKLIRLP